MSNGFQFFSLVVIVWLFVGFFCFVFFKTETEEHVAHSTAINLK